MGCRNVKLQVQYLTAFDVVFELKLKAFGYGRMAVALDEWDRQSGGHDFGACSERFQIDLHVFDGGNGVVANVDFKFEAVAAFEVCTRFLGDAIGVNADVTFLASLRGFVFGPSTWKVRIGSDASLAESFA